MSVEVTIHTEEIVEALRDSDRFKEDICGIISEDIEELVVCQLSESVTEKVLEDIDARQIASELTSWQIMEDFDYSEIPEYLNYEELAKYVRSTDVIDAFNCDMTEKIEQLESDLKRVVTEFTLLNNQYQETMRLVSKLLDAHRPWWRLW